MPHNLKYTPEYTTKKDNIFLEEYYTGADTKIYIDGLNAEFIASLSYSVQENINPLYGYNSYTFDDIAIGNRIVIGSILIPVTNYDTYLVDFTKKTDDMHPVLVEADDFDTSGATYQAPRWISNIPKEEPSEDKIKIQRIVRSRDVATSTPKGTNTGYSQVVRTTVPNDSVVDKKPLFERGTAPYFNEVYSNTSSTLNFIKCRLQDNFKDITVKLYGRDSLKIQTVVFKSSQTTYSANDEPLYENIEFIARDIIHVEEE